MLFHAQSNHNSGISPYRTVQPDGGRCVFSILHLFTTLFDPLALLICGFFIIQQYTIEAHSKSFKPIECVENIQLLRDELVFKLTVNDCIWVLSKYTR